MGIGTGYANEKTGKIWVLDGIDKKRPEKTRNRNNTDIAKEKPGNHPPCHGKNRTISRPLKKIWKSYAPTAFFARGAFLRRHLCRCNAHRGRLKAPSCHFFSRVVSFVVFRAIVPLRGVSVRLWYYDI